MPERIPFTVTFADVQILQPIWAKPKSLLFHSQTVVSC